jgi:hypothetical protein
MKSFFLILIFTFTLHLSHAQKLSFGPRIGANVSRISGLNYAMPRGGWDLGAFIIFKPCAHTGLSADLLLSSNGSRSKHVQESGTMKESWDVYINMNYLKIPLLYNIYLGNDASIFRLKLFAGVSGGLLISSKQSLTYSKENLNSQIDSSSDQNNCSQFKKIDFGGLAGTGFVYKMAENASLNFDVRYYHGFQDIRNQGSSFSAPLFNSNISFLIGLAYLLK